MSRPKQTPRSYLFVPGDAARKIEKAVHSGTEAVILDLEDSVAPSRKAAALQVTREFLDAHGSSVARPEYWVRVNASDPAAALAELAALPLDAIDGIIHPKLAAHGQVERMGHWLDALEARAGADAGATAIIGITTETAAAVVGEQAPTLARGHARLRGYSWGTEDLSAVLGRPPLAGTTDAHATLAHSVQLHCLLTAAAAGVDAIDSVSANFRDADALAAECNYARELGYVAKMAIHPAQIEPINGRLAPSAEAIEWAQRVRALVRENPDAASLALDGRMVDQPHFDVAAGILARAGIDENAE